MAVAELQAAGLFLYDWWNFKDKIADSLHGQMHLKNATDQPHIIKISILLANSRNLSCLSLHGHHEISKNKFGSQAHIWIIIS